VNVSADDRGSSGGMGTVGAVDARKLTVREADDTNLCTLGAQALGRLLERREISPVELITGILQRIDECDPLLNAFCHIARDAAQANAHRAEDRLMRGERKGVLDGIPFSVKDNLFVAGMPASWGSKLYSEFTPVTDDLAPAALVGAGAICIGKTNTPEFALLARTENSLFGRTSNPFDIDRTPGGSSGGAAAALAAGMGPIALATDAGGSIRRPCSYCGLAGLKASPGAIPRRDGFPATVYDFQTVGPMARSIADLRLVFNVIRASRPAATQPGQKRIALVVSGPRITLDEPVRACIIKAAECLTSAGHSVEVIASPWNTDEIDGLWNILSAAGVARIARRHEPGIWRACATAHSQSLAEAGMVISAADYVDALDRLSRLRQAAIDWFDGYDFFFMPASPCTAWSSSEAFPGQIGGVKAGPRSAAVFSTFVNAANLAAVSLPIGNDPDGMPIGGQFVAPAGCDDALLEIAGELEPLLGRISPAIAPDADAPSNSLMLAATR
jgi:aspartyl-tRNA(Asn)/glutamyl-tRNA(Gln) amidotransferase subunit A